MKKFLIVLGMVTCIFGMTACGSGEDTTATDIQIDEEGLNTSVDQFIEQMDQIVASGMKEQYSTTDTITAALSGWEASKEEIGTVQGFTDHVISVDGDSITVTATVDGSSHDAEVVVELDSQYQIISVTTNVIKSFGELMTNAALNTLLGMGTVFIVLILIAWLISLFKYIPAMEKKLADKKAARKAKKAARKAQKAGTGTEAAPVAAAAEPVAEVIDETDDCELVAVIAAAIAASEGSANPEDFVVRSIRRRTGKWQRA